MAEPATKPTRPFRAEVLLGRSEYGNPEPRLVIRHDGRNHWCKVAAAMHRAASHVLLASIHPNEVTSELWCVRVDREWVALEMVETDQGSIKRALATLNAAAAAFHASESA